MGGAKDEFVLWFLALFPGSAYLPIAGKSANLQN
jgi:hypothetical protein